jgi:hypothetical protein
MAGRQSKIRIETLGELKKTFTSYPGCEFCLVVRSDRKIEMDIDQKVIDQLQKLLQKAVGNREENEEY